MSEAMAGECGASGSFAKVGLLALDNLADVPVRELRDMLERCSRRTLRARFLGGGVPAADQLAVQLSCTGAVAGLAARVGDVTVGVGSVDGPAPYELALLVEDRWQRRGVGTRLLAALANQVAAAGAVAVIVSMTVDNLDARRLVHSRWPTARFTTPDAGVVDSTFLVRASDGGDSDARSA